MTTTKLMREPRQLLRKHAVKLAVVGAILAISAATMSVGSSFNPISAPWSARFGFGPRVEVPLPPARATARRPAPPPRVVPAQVLGVSVERVDEPAVSPQTPAPTPLPIAPLLPTSITAVMLPALPAPRTELTVGTAAKVTLGPSPAVELAPAEVVPTVVETVGGLTDTVGGVVGGLLGR